MTEASNAEKSSEVFNPLSFERKLVELVEELRLRRNLEVEGERTLISVMDEKYEEELRWDEQQRRHARDKEDLEQQISVLRRKLEDKVCVSDDEKAKQLVMSRTYSHEIRMLKEELRVSKSEKLNLQKKIQELEGKLNLHNSYQESIVTQISDVRKMIKSILEENKNLTNIQKNVMENVASAKSMCKKYDLCNQHLVQSMTFIGKKYETLKKELVSSWTEITILKQSMPFEEGKCNSNLEIEKLQQKVLNLENLLLSSRKENEKTLSNLLQSNKRLCTLMDKYSEIQEREKQLTKEVELFQAKLDAAEKNLQETWDEMRKNKEEIAIKEKHLNQCCEEIQTENTFSECCICFKEIKPSCDTVTTAVSTLIPEEKNKNCDEEIRNGLIDLQQNPILTKSEMYLKSTFEGFSVDQLSGNSGNKKVTLSNVLKRKFEVIESDDKTEQISLKRYIETNSQSLYCINSGEKKDFNNKMQISSEVSYAPICNTFHPGMSGKLVNSFEDEKYLRLHEQSSKVDEKDENKSITTKSTFFQVLSFFHGF